MVIISKFGVTLNKLVPYERMKNGELFNFHYTLNNKQDLEQNQKLNVNLNQCKFNTFTKSSNAPTRNLLCSTFISQQPRRRFYSSLSEGKHAENRSEKILRKKMPSQVVCADIVKLTGGPGCPPRLHSEGCDESRKFRCFRADRKIDASCRIMAPFPSFLECSVQSTFIIPELHECNCCKVTSSCKKDHAVRVVTEAPECCNS